MDDRLEEIKGRMDDAILIALDNLMVPGKEALRTISKVLPLAYEYKKALTAAAETAPGEIAEHLRELATHAVPKAEFFTGSLLLYRGHKGVR